MGIWEEGRKLRHLRVVQPIAGSWRFRRRAGGKAANATTAIVRTVYACLTYDPGSPFFASHSEQLLRGIHCPAVHASLHERGPKNPVPQQADRSWSAACRRQRHLSHWALNLCA